MEQKRGSISRRLFKTFNLAFFFSSKLNQKRYLICIVTYISSKVVHKELIMSWSCKLVSVTRFTGALRGKAYYFKLMFIMLLLLILLMIIITIIIIIYH